jgi:hypothetical protein
VPDSTAASARDAISKSFVTYIAELERAGPVWDRKPVGAADGEAAWCARQVAGHIAGAGTFFGSGIARLIGVPAPQPQALELTSAPDALAKTPETHGLFMDVANQVHDSQLGLEVDHPLLGKQTVGSILDIVAHHLNDHANQLKTLREA